MLVLNMGVTYFGAAFLAINKVIDHARLQWARTEQCYQSHDIFKSIWAELLNQLFHTPGFKLEHRGGFCPLHHLEGLDIVQRDSFDIQGFFIIAGSAAINHSYGPVNNG